MLASDYPTQSGSLSGSLNGRPTERIGQRKEHGAAAVCKHSHKVIKGRSASHSNGDARRKDES